MNVGAEKVVRASNLVGWIVGSVSDNIDGASGRISKICVIGSAIALGLIVILNCARVFIDKTGVVDYRWP